MRIFTKKRKQNITPYQKIKKRKAAKAGEADDADKVDDTEQDYSGVIKWLLIGAIVLILIGMTL